MKVKLIMINNDLLNPELLKQIFLAIKPMIDISSFNSMTVCYPDNPENPDINDIINCNFARGEKLLFQKIENILAIPMYLVIKFYSHTITDCPECSHKDIERLDRESAEPIAIIILEEDEEESSSNEIPVPVFELRFIDDKLTILH